MKHFRKTPIALIVAATYALPIYVPQALAQPVLEEVIVTARKKEESLMDAPLSVTAVSGAQMNEMGMSNLIQLSSQVPGLTLGTGAQAANIYIRGVGSGVNRGFDQSVGLYVDGVYQSRSKMFTQSMVDLQQVEVLRGPQSILFGKNTIAGAIKIETANPSIGDEFGGSITADYEPDAETARGTLVLSGGLTDTLAGRLALRYQETDGYVDNQFRNADEINGDDTLARATLVWAPVDSLDITGKLSYLDADGTGINRVNPVADPSLLNTFNQPGNSLGLLDLAGAIAAFATPGYQAATGGAEYDSWVGNEGFFPGGSDESDVESTQASVAVNWDLGDYTLSSVSAYTDWDETRQQDVDFHPGNVAGNLEKDDFDQWSQELRIASHFDGRFNFVAGLYYEEQDGTFAYTDTVVDGSLGGVFGALPASALIPGAPDGLTLSDLGINSIWNGDLQGIPPLSGVEIINVAYQADNDVNNDTFAAFGEVQFNITDNLTLELGGRYSDDSKEWYKTQKAGVGIPGDLTILVDSDGSFTEAGQANPAEARLAGIVAGSALGRPVAANTLKRDETHFDPSVRLLWDINDDTMTYLSWSTGYKSGGITGGSDSINPDGTPGDGTFFGDETAAAWELGVKSAFWDGRARVSAAVFYTEIDDLQVTAFQGISFRVSNAAEMTTQGVEIESQFALTEEVEVGANIAYLDAEYDDFGNAACTIFQEAALSGGGECAQDLGGEAPPFAPEWSGNFYASYETYVGDNLLLRLRGDANYKDDYFTDGDLDPNTLQESYWKYDARISVGSADGTWELAAYGRNLSDERVISFSIDAPLSAGIYGGGVDEPRVYGLQGTYNF